MPAIKVATEIIAEHIVTERKLLNTLMEQSAGKMIRLDISILPIRRIPTTIVTAVSSAMSILYIFALVPVALAKFSSNVIANIFV